MGADAVINSAEENVAERLLELHGAGESMFPGKVGTDIYFDAAGAPAVIDTALAAAKPGARLGVVAVHKQPVPVDFLNIMSNEITIVGSMGYPDEIFEVTKDLIANWEKIRGDRQPHDPLRRRRGGAEDRLDTRRRRQGRRHLQLRGAGDGVGFRDRSGVPEAARLGGRVRPRGGRAARPGVSAPAVRAAGRQAPQGDRPAQGRGAPEGVVGHPSGARAGRTGLRPAQARAAERDPGPLAVGADRLRLPGARHRQRRDHRPLRHRRAEESATCGRCSTASCSPATR